LEARELPEYRTGILRGRAYGSKKIEPKKLSTSNTKQEMLDSYSAIVKQLKEKEEGELKPEKRVEQKRVEEVVKTAEGVSADTIATQLVENHRN
jgi:hypothetical protein